MLIDKKLTTLIDRPEVGETFIDTVEGMALDGFCLRVELSVTRLDAGKRTGNASGRRYPVCRLVMPPTTVVELYNQLSQVINAMEKKGKVKKGQQNLPAVQGPPSAQQL